MITINLDLEPPVYEYMVRDAIDVSDFGLTKIDTEYPTPLGRIDILTIDGNGLYVPIEVKLDDAGDKSIGQILGYMKATDAQRGIIVASGFSDRVNALSKDLNIDLIPYINNDKNGSLIHANDAPIDTNDASEFPDWIRDAIDINRSFIESIQ